MPDLLSIDVIVESPLWAAQPDAETLLRKAVNEAASVMSTTPAELAIVLTDDSRIGRLNREWRSIDKATNVLSFPAQAMPVADRIAAMQPVPLGDIVIAYETTAAEARAEAKSFAAHLAHLAVHGFLHLVGQDHEGDDEAEMMEGLERAILARLGIADPYAARDQRPDAHA